MVANYLPLAKLKHQSQGAAGWLVLSILFLVVVIGEDILESIYPRSAYKFVAVVDIDLVWTF